MISSLINDNYQHITLGHLSKDNNYEELAYETIACKLKILGCDLTKLGLNVAKKNIPSELVHI